MSEIDRTPERVGIVGLGLIGGSFAKAYADAGIEVFAADIDERAMNAAMAEETVAGPLDEATIPTCELLILAVYPQAIIEWVRSHEQFISPSTLVIDCGSVKRSVCPVCFSIAERRGFTFIGGHPMAGLQYSGYRHARADLYAGQPMVLVPPEIYDPDIILWAEEALSPAAFGSFSITTAAKHDQIIAYTSQLCPCGELRVHQKPHRAKASRFFRWQLQGSHSRRRAQCRYVDRAVYGQRRQSYRGNRRCP